MNNANGEAFIINNCMLSDTLTFPVCGYEY